MAELRATPGLLGPFAAYSIMDEQDLHKTFKETDDGGGVGRLFHRVQRDVRRRDADVLPEAERRLARCCRRWHFAA